MNNVFPESLNNLPEDPYEAIKVLENYIRYMTERIDFALTSGLKIGGRNLTQLSQEVTGLEYSVETINGEITDIGTALDTKVDKETGKGLSTEDYTTAEKTKLSGIEAQANKTTVDSARSSSSTNPLQNKVIDAALTSISNQIGVFKFLGTVPVLHGQTAYFNTVKNQRGFGFVSGASAAVCTMFIFNATSANVVTIGNVNTVSGITVTGGNGKITITNSTTNVNPGAFFFEVAS